VQGLDISVTDARHGELILAENGIAVVRTYSKEDGVTWEEVLRIFEEGNLLSPDATHRAYLKLDPGFRQAIINGDYLICSNGIRPLSIYAIPRRRVDGIVDPIARLHLGYSADAMVMNDDRLHVISKEGKIIIVDLAEPEYPTIVKEHDFTVADEWIRGVTKTGGTIYAATDSRILRIDPDGISEYPLSQKLAYITGVTTYNGSVIFATKENEGDTFTISSFDEGKISTIVELLLNSGSLANIGGSVYILEGSGFYRLSKELTEIDAIHRTITGWTPRPILVGDKLIGNRGEYIEYR